MPSLTIHYRTDAERRDIERAATYVAELHQSAQGRPPADLLSWTPARGWPWTRGVPCSATAWPRRSRPASTPPRGGDAQRLSGGHRGRHKGRRPRSPLTALGPLTLHRTYCQCPARTTAGLPADRLLGETVGGSLGAETLQLPCHAEAGALSNTRGRRLDAAAAFARARGDWELQVDAGKVDTTEG